MSIGSLRQSQTLQTLRFSPHDDSHHLLIYEPTKTVYCCMCKYDVSSFTHFLCEGVYCISCFIAHLSIPNQEQVPSTDVHYRVINKLDFEMFDRGWTARDELLLFEGLCKYGLGKWEEISRVLANPKSAEEVQKHYLSVYCCSPDFLPVTYQWIQTGYLKDNVTSFRQKQNQNDTQKIVKNQCNFNRSSKKNKRGKLKKRNKSQSHGFRLQAQQDESLTSSMFCLGYMPQRQDFHHEYDNEAEQILVSVEFTNQDTELQIEYKYTLINHYNERLRQRNLRKEFVITNNILNQEIQTDHSCEEKSLKSAVERISYLIKCRECDTLRQGIQKAEQIKQILCLLKTMKSRIGSQDECKYQRFAEYINKNK